MRLFLADLCHKHKFGVLIFVVYKAKVINIYHTASPAIYSYVELYIENKMY